MGARQKRVVLFLAIYACLFWIGFKSGEIHNRMRNKLRIEIIPIVGEPPARRPRPARPPADNSMAYSVKNDVVKDYLVTGDIVKNDVPKSDVAKSDTVKNDVAESDVAKSDAAKNDAAINGDGQKSGAPVKAASSSNISVKRRK